MKWYLETERLQLRPLNKSDAQNLFDLNNDPGVLKYLGKESVSMEVMEDVVQKVMARDLSYQNQFGLFAAIEKESGDFIGWFILRPAHETPEDTKNLEIGWRLRTHFWGKGYATEGALALIEKARTKIGAHRVFATAMSENLQSIRIMEKIGLQLERKFMDTDEYWGEKPVSVVQYAVIFKDRG